MKIEIADEQIDAIMIAELKAIIEHSQEEELVLAAKILLREYQTQTKEFEPVDWAK